MSNPPRSARAAVSPWVLLLLTGSLGAAAAQSSVQLHPAFNVSLFASEPDIVDPVALTFDADGRVYVVEMRDYPYGIGSDLKPGGRVKLLEDTNGDGRADRSVVFADDLSFPTAIAPWKGGVIVAAPPEIVFLEDTDQDGRADIRRVLVTGFRLGVTDSNVNGLRWGLDNLLHGVNGGNGGQLQASGELGPSLSIRNLDFSFDPATGRIQPTYHTSAGFGLVFNEWGDSFGTYNIDHIQQRILPVRYLNRFPGLPPMKGTESISDHGEMARIYPISTPETRPNHPEQAGHFSSAGGLGYLGAEFPGDLAGSVLVCDVVGNLVHRDQLVADGPIYRARRAPGELTREFYASGDNRVRPVGVELGPDGALYLLDMQRDVIEHPDYIPERLRRQLDIRAGEDRGRIYRLMLTNSTAARPVNLSSRPSQALLPLLGDRNAWWRGAAQRLLVERRDKSVAPALRVQLNQDPNPLARLHALWTLAGLAEAGQAEILTALRDSHPRLRQAGVTLSEVVAPAPAVDEMLLALADDPDARVRFEIALVLGSRPTPQTFEALARLLWRDRAHRWSRRAVYTSLAPGQETLLCTRLLASGILISTQGDPSIPMIEELAELVGARASRPLGEVLGLLNQQAQPILIAGLRGLAKGLERAARPPSADEPTLQILRQLSRHPSLEIVRSAWTVSRALRLPEDSAQVDLLRRAASRVQDTAEPLSDRLNAIALLEFGVYLEVADPLFAVLTAAEPAQLQLAALNVLSAFSDVDLAGRLLRAWRSLQPAVRTPAINLLLRKRPFHEALVTAIEAQEITLGELNLDLEQRRRLLRQSEASIQARAARFITDEEYGNRKSLVEEWLTKLPADGDAAAARPIFEQRCASCHSLNGIGHRVGPDLGATAHRSVEDLAGNILDPNMAIHPNYIAYTVDLKNGDVEHGLLHSESDDALILLQSEGREVVIPRREIKELRASGVSLMPEGLEQGLTPQELRDLIALLQSALPAR